MYKPYCHYQNFSLLANQVYLIAIAVPSLLSNTVKLGIKELLNKEQIGFKELFTDYQLFYTINLLLNKELLPI